MKNILLLSILLFAGSAIAAPTAKEIAAYDANKRTQLIEWIEQLRVKAGEADTQAKTAQDALAENKTELAAATANLATLQKDIKNLTDWGIQQQALYQDQQKQTAKYKHEAHVKSTVIDIGICIVAAAVTIIVLMCAGQIIGFIVKIFPAAAPFGALIEIGLLVGAFGITFGILRGALAVIESRL